ncbi:hypothetical protein JJ691_95190 [Kutzneria sp. CA-103260]|nr:hypothetical protein JJ691_95190 [Kutzneria sp. CA-103260]
MRRPQSAQNRGGSIEASMTAQCPWSPSAAALPQRAQNSAFTSTFYSVWFNALTGIFSSSSISRSWAAGRPRLVR